MKDTNKVILIVMDGWGIAPSGKGNAIDQANTPNFDKFIKEYPHTHIGAGGKAIGLWKDHQGSSEIGHLIIGAGRNVILPQAKIKKAIKDKSILQNRAYQKAIENCKKKKSALHIAGLLSDKGVHAYDETCHALIEMSAKAGLEEVYVHVITDGRDTDTHVAKKYIDRLIKVMKKFKVGKIASVMGRYWIMDRDKRWDRVEIAYNALTKGIGYQAKDAYEAIETAYKRERKEKTRGETVLESDEFIEPTLIVQDEGENQNPIRLVKDKDSFILFNFRVDRAIEITQAFVEKDFADFEREKKLDITYIATTKYYDKMKVPYAFKRDMPKNTLGEVVSKNGLKQFRLAETEKWVYVTRVFNGITDEIFKGEERMLIPSDKIPTYDLKPKMKAKQIADAAVKAMKSDKYSFIFVNLANPDILGHTGNVEAIIEGCEAVDRAMGKMVKNALKNGFRAIVTADHGNAEMLYNKDGSLHSNHTANDVPIFIAGAGEVKLTKKGALCDVAPTVLELMNLAKPAQMSGKSLIRG